jgi:hypothetical protein
MRLPLYSDYVRQNVFMTTDEGSGLGFAVVRGSRLHRAIELKTLLPPIISISPYLVGLALIGEVVTQFSILRTCRDQLVM